MVAINYRNLHFPFSDNVGFSGGAVERSVSFAQFEREVTVERIRYKLKASHAQIFLGVLMTQSYPAETYTLDCIWYDASKRKPDFEYPVSVQTEFVTKPNSLNLTQTLQQHTEGNQSDHIQSPQFDARVSLNSAVAR